MNKNDFMIEQIGDKLICLKGIGKLFYQSGFPISIAISKLKEQGIESSVLHIADECLKHGWSSETTFKKLREDIIDGNFDTNLKYLKQFCYADYDAQREMIFESLFGNIINIDVDFLKKFVTNKLK